MTTCQTCHEAKPLTEFYKNGHGGHRKSCKPCHPKKTPRQNRNSLLKLRYGITVEDYERMESEQRGACAICGTEACVSGRRLAVDHDHTTGEVRGLLCANCNRAVGLFQDNPESLDKAAQYLRGGASSVLP